jgi:AbrB family looped-hinge helix DNA binding protein
MKTTIDKAGRVVIPARIREQLHLKAGTELEVEVDDLSIRLVRRVKGPKLVRMGKLLVAKPQVPPEQLPKIDVAKLIREERDRWPPWPR